MEFHYVAADKAGKIREGDIDASSVADVLAFIARNDFKPVSIKPIRAVFSVGKLGLFEKITLQDRLFLTKYLSLMLRVGTDLLKAIDTLIEDFEKQSVRRFLLEVKANLEKGNPFYVSFQSHPEIFSAVVVNLIKAAESSGNLEHALADISMSYAKESDLRSRVQGALTYPLLLLFASMGIVTLFVTFVVPKIADTFAQTEAKIPLYSRIVLTVGLFFNHYLFIIFPLIFVIAIGGWYLFFKTLRGRTALNRFIKKVPVARDLVEKMALARFAMTFSSLLKAGIPIIQALDIAADAAGEEDFKAAILRISQENITRGVSIGDAFRKETIFPKVFTTLMAIGEKAGHLEEILATLSQFYDSEIDSSLKTLVSFVEPLLLLMIGLMIATIALSVIVPIYQLVGQF